MNASPDVSFDGWSLRSSTGELLKGDTRIRLSVQSASVLQELLSRPGELVTREALIAKLWPRGVVDYDTALNTIVHRLRVALGDRAERPKYIETVPRRGYRFIGRVGHMRDQSIDAAPVEPDLRVPAGAGVDGRPVLPRKGWTARVGVTLALVLSIAVGGAVGALTDGFNAQRPIPAAAEARAAVEQIARARFLMQRREPGDVASARRNFIEAIADEPGNAAAWAGLAGTYWLDVVEGRASDAQGIPRVIEAAERAIELEPRLAEAHVRLAQSHARRGARVVADTHLELARASAPDDALVLAMVVEKALASGRLAEAADLQRRAVAAEPLAIAVRQNLVALLLLGGRLDEAAAENLRLRELNPNGASYRENQAEFLLLQGRFDEALVVAQALARGPERSFFEAVAYHGLGRYAEADASLHALIDFVGANEQSRVAEALATLGRRTAALDLLEVREACQGNWLRYSPYLRSLHTEPRWQAWIRSAPHADAS